MATPSQPATPRLEKLLKQIEKRMRAEDRIVADEARNMLASASEMLVRIQRRISRLDLDSRGLVKQTDRNLAEINKINALIDQTISQASNVFARNVSQRRAELTDFYKQEIKSIRPAITNKRFAQIVDAKQTRAVFQTNLSNVQAAGETFVQQMRRQLNASLFEDIGPEEMSKRVSQFIRGTDKNGKPLTRHAETFARTAYNAYGNALATADIDPTEIVAYHYTGPQDDANRSFCAQRVGRTWEKEQLETAIQNQAPAGATIQNPGGFNCRHQLIPITIFDAEAEPFLTDEKRRELNQDRS